MHKDSMANRMYHIRLLFSATACSFCKFCYNAGRPVACEWVSEWVSELNGTSAQLGMAVPIMLDVLDVDGSTLPSLSVRYVLHLFIREWVSEWVDS